MKKLTQVIIIFLMLSGFINAESEITFKATTLDWGEVENGKIANLIFEFENTGDSLLVIKQIKSTCGCTVTHVDKKEYKPGEKGKIPVKFNSRGYSNRGKILKSITVITNSKKDNGYTRLKLTGKVKVGDTAICKVFPDKLKLNVILGTPQTRKIAITNTGTKDLKLLEFTHNPELSLSVNKAVIKPKESAELSITINPFQIGNHSSFIKIRTNQYGRAITLIKFRAFIKNK